MNIYVTSLTFSYNILNTFFLNLQLPKFKASCPTINMRKCYKYSIFSMFLSFEHESVFILVF